MKVYLFVGVIIVVGPESDNAHFYRLHLKFKCSFCQCDTDMRSLDATTEGSSNLPDVSGRLLHRAIDQKVRKLRSMLSADEDITTELDRVVCRLMKLALKTSRGRKTALPTKWMHCKLYDLLTLTEKTIERRRQHFIENYSFRAIGYGDEGQELAALVKFREDKAGLELVDKYHHLVNKTGMEDKDVLYDDLSLLSDGSKGNELVTTRMSIFHPSWLQPRKKSSKSNLDRTEAWVNDDTGLLKYLNRVKDNFIVGDNDVEQSISNGSYNHCSLTPNKCKSSIKYCTHVRKSSCKTLRSKHKTEQKEGNRQKSAKKILHNKSSHFTKGSIVKMSTTNVGNFKLRKCEINSSLFQPTKSKPIPDSLIKLCSSKYNQVKITKKNSPTTSEISKRETEVKVSEMNESYDRNEGSNMENITTSVELPRKMFVPQHSLSKMTETDKETSIPQKTETEGAIEESPNMQLEINEKTIFLYDINEPSTSKGVRHINMDVQCGPDISFEHINHAVVTSCTDMCTGVEMGNSVINTAINSTDFGTSMYRDDKVYRTLVPRIKSVGIKIRDSDFKFSDNNNRSTITDQTADVTTSTNLQQTSLCVYNSVTETDIFHEGRLIHCFKDKSLEDNSNKTLPKILSLIHDAPENIKTYLSSSPKTLETNLANCLISRLKLCYSGIRIRRFKSKQEFQDAFPEKTLQATPNVNKCRKKENNLKNLKRDTKLKIVHPKSNTKETKKNDVTENKSIQKRKPSSLNKNVLYENRASKKVLQIRNPKLTIMRQKWSNDITEKDFLPITQSGSPQSRQPNIKKVQSKKGLSSDLKNKPKNVNTICARKEVNNSKNDNKSKKNIPVSKYLKDNNKNKKRIYNLNKSVDTVKHNIKMNSNIPVLKKSKTEEIKIKLSKLQPKVFSEYYVYRNETKNSLKALEAEKDPNVRSSSPQSVQSSTCSSPTSIQTVKLRPKSLSPNSHTKIRTLSPDSKSISSIRSKKSLKIGRKISEGKFDENKENDIDYELSPENTFLENKVFIAKLNSTPLQSTENSLVKRKSSKSVRISDLENVDDKKETFVVKNLSSKSISTKKVEHDHITILDQDVQYVLHDNSFVNYPRSSTPVHEEDNDGYRFRQMIENSMKDGLSLDVVTPLVDDIIEGTIVLPESTNGNSHAKVNTRTVTLEHDDYQDDRFEDSLSLSFGSGKTTVENVDIIKEHDDEDDPNTTINTIIARDLSLNNLHIVPEAEVLSFHPTTSCSPRNTPVIKNNSSSSPVTYGKESVLDLFERKNPLAPPVNASPLALQAFSGFSVNTEPIPGDQPDYVNQIDSETGSGANEVNRQATSEELFVSGRSSVMYESCLIEEDTVVPEWLFQIINHQQIDLEETPELHPAVLPVSEPMYDMNGNAVEPAVGNEAGAGDGRGVHSDVSQDSSGQGSSITSSDTSSAPQSEAILIDPSVLAGQYPTTLPLQMNSDSFRSAQESSDNTDPPRSSREVHHDAMALLGASDADADESSLDTDAD